jgi:hypothetical protein
MVSPVTEQLTEAIRRISSRYSLFIPYLQPFSNTYGAVDRLRAVYEPLIAVPGVVGLAVGTRPDCLLEEVCGYLAGLASRTYLSVEIGLQSMSDTTLADNNRGHTSADFIAAVKRLANRGIQTVAHVMLGMRGDTAETMMYTARQLAELPVHGVKIHQLMIIKGTQVAQWFAAKKVKPLELEEYAALAAEFISLLRPDQCIHRIMADSKPEHGLLAPLWSARKMQSVMVIKKFMKDHGLFQGKMYSGTSSVTH